MWWVGGGCLEGEISDCLWLIFSLAKPNNIRGNLECGSAQPSLLYKIVLFTMYYLDNVKQRMTLLYDRNDEHRLDVGTLRMLVYIPVTR